MIFLRSYVFPWADVVRMYYGVTSFFDKSERAVYWHLCHFWVTRCPLVWKIWRHLCLGWVFLGYTATNACPVTKKLSQDWMDLQHRHPPGWESKLHFWKTNWCFEKAFLGGWKAKLSVSSTATCPCFWNAVCSPSSLALRQPAEEHWSPGAGELPWRLAACICLGVS